MTEHVAVRPEADPSIMTPLEEHEELRGVVRHLLEKDADHEAVRRAVEQPRGWSEDLWQRLNRELDLGSMIVPESLGGAGFGLRDLAVVLEETGGALLSEPVLESSVLVPLALALADDSDAVADLLADVASGRLVGTVAFDSALTVEDGRVRGSVRRVVAGAESDLVIAHCAEGIVAVRLGGEENAAADGVSIRPLEVIDPTRRQADLELDGAAATILVGPDRADAVWAQVSRAAAIAVAAEHVGIIRRQLDATVEYVTQREQFGRPIGSFQAIKHRLADVLVDLERSRSAVDYAAALFDEDPEAELAAEVAGAVVTDAAMRTVHEAVQLSGGIGFTWEHPAHFYLKRVLGDEGLFGTARGHRNRVADLIGI
ncbi:acyl-CoA dehydrogenase family protein [Nocardioides sp. GXZ039]|uniref:acyl-CoA dehydrogenase family protein n=1 Tax=Nocardioides sp. GXZ039 TaxID=3136018 RepID=UPI0030F4687C